MKLSDFFKKIGLDIESDVDITNSDTLDSDIQEKKDDVVTNQEKEGKKKMAFVKPKADKNGFIDLTSVEDADLKAFFKELNDNRKIELDNRKAEADKRLIDESVKSAVDSLKLNKGITVDAVSKLLDLTNVKVSEDGKVTGVEDAIKSLQTSQSGLFLTNKNVSSPLLEGYNPVNVANKGTIPNSFAEAFAMEELA